MKTSSMLEKSRQRCNQIKDGQKLWKKSIRGRAMKNNEREKQAGAELCQAQLSFKLA